jgi:hypothetical protein
MDWRRDILCILIVFVPLFFKDGFYLHERAWFGVVLCAEGPLHFAVKNI